MRLIAKMRGINVKKSTTTKKTKRKKKEKITYKESPFRPVIQDIKDKLSKSGDKLIKKGLYYVEKMKELTELQVKIIKEKLIKSKNELIRKIELKKIMIFIMLGIMVALHIMVLKILDICLMKMKMKIKIS